jgi:archaellum component FlaC
MKARYTKIKSTGHLFEHQGGGDESNPQHLQTLIDNAISAGHNKEDIEAGYEDEEIVRGWLKDANEANKTYKEKRKDEYNQLNQYEMMFDDKRDGTTTWVDKINEIKNRHPKND